MKDAITAHMIVKNEEQWVWYALQSILPYVDKVIVYDTGSTDDTIKIIKSITSPKIHLELYSSVNASKLVKLRNAQIAATETNWFMLIDGDEVWPRETILELKDTLSQASNLLVAIAIRTWVPVGDVYHFQDESAGRYEVLGHRGHLNVRVFKKSEQYRWEGLYPLEAYIHRKSKLPVQQQTQALLMLKQKYWHMTHLVRSSVDTHHKRKYEIGIKRILSLPEVFYFKHPDFVPSPFESFSLPEKLIAWFLTPLLHLKRSMAKI